MVNIPEGTYVLPDCESERTILVSLPGTPVEQTKTVDSEFGKLSLDIQMFETKVREDNLVYIAMETKYPSGVIEPGDKHALNIFYRKAIGGSLNSVNGKLISIDDIYYKGSLGKEYRCHVSGGHELMVYRYFFIDDNFHSLGVITLPDKDHNQNMSAFFDSFGIKE